MSRTIRTKVVGVTKKNEDGESRQEIIEYYVKPGDELLLDKELTDELEPAIAVYHGPMNQIGYIGSGLAKDLTTMMSEGKLITAYVKDKTGGDEGESYGVNIEIFVFTPEETAIIKKREQELKDRYEYRLKQVTETASVSTQSAPHQVNAPASASPRSASKPPLLSGLSFSNRNWSIVSLLNSQNSMILAIVAVTVLFSACIACCALTASIIMLAQ